MKKRQNLISLLALTTTALALSAPGRTQEVTPAEARAIAKEAYVYGYPMVDSYRIEYGYFVNEKDPEYKGPWNQIHNTPRVYTPADKAIQTPNSDTPYSWLGLDLRAEPMVLTMPVIEKDRYFSVQLTDLRSGGRVVARFYSNRETLCIEACTMLKAWIELSAGKNTKAQSHEPE